jgi:hypothetical protein
VEYSRGPQPHLFLQIISGHLSLRRQSITLVHTAEQVKDLISASTRSYLSHAFLSSAFMVALSITINIGDASFQDNYPYT